MPLTKRDKRSVKRMINRNLETKAYTTTATWNAINGDNFGFTHPLNCPKLGNQGDEREGNEIEVVRIEAQGEIHAKDTLTGGVEHVHVTKFLLMLDRRPVGDNPPAHGDVFGWPGMPSNTTKMLQPLNWNHRHRFVVLSEFFVRTFKFVTSGSTAEGGFFPFKVPISRRAMRHRVTFKAKETVGETTSGGTPDSWGSIVKNALFMVVVTPHGFAVEDAKPDIRIVSTIYYKDI